MGEDTKCPRCGYVFDEEDLRELVTYWGDAGPQAVECSECELALLVTEHVNRTFEVKCRLTTGSQERGKRKETVVTEQDYIDLMRERSDSGTWPEKEPT